MDWICFCFCFRSNFLSFLLLLLPLSPSLPDTEVPNQVNMIMSDSWVLAVKDWGLNLTQALSACPSLDILTKLPNVLSLKKKHVCYTCREETDLLLRYGLNSMINVMSWSLWVAITLVNLLALFYSIVLNICCPERDHDKSILLMISIFNRVQ